MVLDTLVVGAGLSGLSTAIALAPHSPSLLVAERRDRVGGNITSRQQDGFLWEEGPTSFQPAPALLELALEVGLGDELVFANAKLPRYVYWQGRLRPVPMSPPAAVGSSLLSPLGKLRALAGALGFVPPPQPGEETVAAFFRRHLGAEVAQRLVAPFVSGVYAGDPQQLSATAAFRRVTQLEAAGGGLVAGALRARRQAPPPKVNPDLPRPPRGSLGSFRQGIGMLPQAIAERLGDRLRLRWELLRVQPTEQQTYQATFATPEGEQQVEARSLVLSLPAYTIADLLKPLQPAASQALAAIPYPPVVCAVLAYPQAAIARPLDGFGHLIPRGQGLRTLGTIWSSSLFPGRAPQGWQVLTNFIGGATDPEVANLTADELVAAVHRDLQQVLLQPDAQPKPLAVHLWPRAIPQYSLGHAERLAAVDRALSQQPGLFLCSNFTDSVALGDCVRRGREIAQTVQAYLGRPTH